MAVYGYVAHIKIGFVFRDPCGSVCMLNSGSYFGSRIQVYGYIYECVAHIKIGFVFRGPCGRVCMLNSDSDFGRLVGVYVCYIGI